MKKKVGAKHRADAPVKVRTSGIEGVLQAYFDLAFSIGVDKITLAGLSEKTGLSPSNVKYHIDNCEMGLESLAIQKVRQSVNIYLEDEIFKDRSGNKFDPLKSYARHMLHWSQEFPQFSTYLLFIYYRTSTLNGMESGEGQYDRILKKAHSRIEGLLNEGIGMGIYAIDQKLRKDFIKTFHALVLGQLVILINLRPKTEIDGFLTGISTFVESISGQ